MSEVNKAYMQNRCIHCKGELYAIAVSLISTKGGMCHNCGGEIVPMSKEEYLEKLRGEK